MTKKEETIEKYKEEFLGNRSEEARREFLSRSIDRQYASIMAWKHRQYSADKGMHDVESLIDGLRVVRKSLPLVENIDEKDLKKLRKELGLVEVAIAAYEKQQRVKEIKELEQQQKELVKRLTILKGEA